MIFSNSEHKARFASGSLCQSQDVKEQLRIMKSLVKTSQFVIVEPQQKKWLSLFPECSIEIIASCCFPSRLLFLRPVAPVSRDSLCL